MKCSLNSNIGLSLEVGKLVQASLICDICNYTAPTAITLAANRHVIVEKLIRDLRDLKYMYIQKFFIALT